MSWPRKSTLCLSHCSGNKTHQPCFLLLLDALYYSLLSGNAESRHQAVHLLNENADIVRRHMTTMTASIEAVAAQYGEYATEGQQMMADAIQANLGHPPADGANVDAAADQGAANGNEGDAYGSQG